MKSHAASLSSIAGISALALLAACSTPSSPQTGAATAQPVVTSKDATWFTATFGNGSFAIDGAAKTVVASVATYLTEHPGTTATIIGRTDTVGSADYNMRLSHRRADAVRDALVYDDKVAAARIETRWTGERGAGPPPADAIAVASNRVVDIAVH